MLHQQHTASFLEVVAIALSLCLISHKHVFAFHIPQSTVSTSFAPEVITIFPPVCAMSISNDDSSATNSDDDNDEVSRIRAKAESLRDEIRRLEENLGDRSTANNNDKYIPKEKDLEPPLKEGEKTLLNKSVLVVGANGRLGSMVTRHLLRNHPEVEEVVATVHYVGDFSTRGYGRLSYEVGAEDGVGRIGPAWSDESDATFEYSDTMKDYNLDKLRIVECELLDPEQCNTITEGIDSVIWCATDFNGNTPRAVSSLDLGLAYRAIMSPRKGRVEIEGLTNILGGLKQYKMNKKQRDRIIGNDDDSSSLDGPNDPTSVVLVSSSPYVLMNFETPFGEFNALKRQGESILRDNFPSLSSRVLQMGKYEDNFVDESLEIIKDNEEQIIPPEEMSRRKINRRDAARAAVDALLDASPENTAQIWTALKG